MPYSNLPKSQWAAMDKCVADVQATGKDKQAAIAICYTSISKQQGDDEMSRQDRAKAKKRRASKQAAVITDLSELGQAFGWSEKDVKASYPWDSCIADQMKKYGSRTRAEKICGAIRANAGKALSDERIATIISLSPVTAPNFRAMAAEAKENPNHVPAGSSHGGEFASGGGSGGGASFSRGFSAKYAEQISKEGIKPHAGTTYASTAEEVAHHYGVNQALVRDKSKQYAIVTFKAGNGTAVYPNSPKSKKGDYAQMRGDTFFKFDKTITPDQIVSVKVYEVDPKNLKAKPKLVKQYKDNGGQDGLFHVAAVINADGELEFIQPDAKPEAKGITDAPNLRGEDAQCCGNCQYYKELASGDNGMSMGMMQSEPPDDSGICTKFDFEADSEWVCDAWEAVASPDVAGAIQDAAQAIADAADGMNAMGKEEKAHVAVADMPRDQQQAVFATLAESGAIASAHPIVQTAHKHPIADMGQLSHEQKNALESAVKKGLLKKGKGGGFPIAKTVYAHPSYDIAGEHQRQVSHLRAIAGLESRRLFGKEGHLITADELIARAEALEAATGKSAEQLLRDAVAEQEAAFDKAARPLTLFKQADGRLRVVGWASNNRRDKDNPPEIITEAAHKEFMAYLDAHPEHAPEFWHWHTPGTKYAKSDWWDYADGFTVYSGLVDVGKEAQAEKAAADGIGMSHGFHVLGYDNANHHITQYRTFEVSDLPKSRAANPYTSFSTIRKEASMAFSEAKKAYLLERLPAETVAELERKTSDLKAAADAAGIEAKDIEDTPAEVATEVAAPVDEKADSKPTDKPAEVAADGGNAKPKADTSNTDMMQMMSDMIDKKLAAMGKEVNAAVLTVAEAVKGINERVATVEETAAKAEEVAKTAVVVNAKSLDEIVAEMISPAPLRKGYRASAAADTRVPAKKDGASPAASVVTVEEPTLPGSPADWWTKEVMKPAGLA